MKAQWLVVLVVFASLVLISTWPVSAQGPEPTPTPPAGEQGQPPESTPDLVPLSAPSDLDLVPPMRQPKGRTTAPVLPGPLALGAPGFSLRYERTFGLTERAYFDDSAHINGAYGLGTSGTNLWVAECEGRRALNYTSGGAFVKQIGKAGYRYVNGTTIECFADVGVDAAGNIWAVDRSASHAIQFDAAGNRIRELGQMWTRGKGSNQFDDPWGIAFDTAGNIYVSDGNNHRLQVFRSNGAYLRTIGAGTPGKLNSQFNGPRHIAIDSSNFLYIADSNNHRVQIFNVSNPAAITFVATLGVPGVAGADNAHLNSPQGVAVDVARGRIYVADANNKRVQVFNRVTRAYLTTVSIPSYTSDVAVDSAGNLYVSEPWFDRDEVRQFNSGLVYVRTYGTTGVPYLSNGYLYNRPSGLAIAPDGSIYIGESGGRRLIKLNSAGTVQWIKGAPGDWGRDNNHFTYVEDVTLDSSGRVYAVDRSNHRVQIYNPDGTYYATLGTGSGSGSLQFSNPYGAAVDSAGRIYVADTNNHRVQVFSSTRAYLATMGVTGVKGSDNGHFDSPRDVHVDSVGYIYVVDQNNHRVQVFNSSRVYIRTIGVSGVLGTDFAHLQYPTAVTTDAFRRAFVADQWGGRVQVFDSNGAYLTTVGGTGGTRTGSMSSAEAVATDAAGNLYVAERENHRIQKLAVGVPGWTQVNINGLGDRSNVSVSTLAPFGSYLYAGTNQSGTTGAQLWRKGVIGAWTAVSTNGFGDASNLAIEHLAEFNGNLYAGTAAWNYAANQSLGIQIWRSSNGTAWSRIALPGLDPTNGEIPHLIVFENKIYFSTWSNTTAHGAEIWRSDTGDSNTWVRVLANGNGNAHNSGIPALEGYNGYLYAGVYNRDTSASPSTSTGGQVWRTDDGTTWSAINTNGFGDPQNYAVRSFAVLGGQLYAGTANYSYATGTSTGGKIFRCTVCDGSDWSAVMTNGFGDTNNQNVNGLIAFDNALYAVTSNSQTGMEVWRTFNGTSWAQVAVDGFGDSNNRSSFYSNNLAAFNGALHLGTNNTAHGGELWRLAAASKSTTTALTSAPNPSLQGSTVTFTAVVTSTSGTPTGTVTFKEGTTLLGSGTLSAGRATLKIWSLPVGSHAITAQYNGDSTYAGSVSPVRTQVVNLPPIIKVENEDIRIQYDLWRGIAASGANGGTYRSSNHAGDTAAFRFTGPAITWVTKRGPDQGQAQILVDGVLKGTVDLYSPTVQMNYPRAISGLTSAAHTLMIKVLGTKNASATAANVVVDALIVGTTTTQDNSPSIVYSKWGGGTNGLASGGSYRFSGTAGSAAAFRFVGTSVEWITLKGPGYGKASVYIDGVLKGTYDLYQPTLQWQAVIPFTGLKVGIHTIEVRPLGTKNAASTGVAVLVDAFRGPVTPLASALETGAVASARSPAFLAYEGLLTY